MPGERGEGTAGQQARGFVRKNIDELLENLQATFNQLRQSGIDEELFDVISGFEALVGQQQASAAQGR